MQKISIGIREAKINLSKLVKDVRQGTEIILTDRGNPVARLTPLKKNSLSLQERLKQLENSGWIELANKKSRNLPPPLPLPTNQAQHLLQQERNYAK